MAGSDEARREPGEITRLLVSISEGDRDALNRLFPIVYAELRARAHHQLRHMRPGDTLQPTALVHEAYVKLLGAARPKWHDRRHFFAVASRAMRQITVDYARSQAAQKRGGVTPALSLDEERLPVAARAHDLVQLDLAPAWMVALLIGRGVGGLSVEETATVIEVAERTIKREWQKARAFLFDALQREGLS